MGIPFLVFLKSGEMDGYSFSRMIVDLRTTNALLLFYERSFLPAEEYGRRASAYFFVMIAENDARRKEATPERGETFLIEAVVIVGANRLIDGH